MPSELDPVSRLVQHSTSVVSDALDELGMHCVLPEIRAQRIGQPRIAGVALPVWFKPKSHDPDAYRFGGGVGKPLEQVWIFGKPSTSLDTPQARIHPADDGEPVIRIAGGVQVHFFGDPLPIETL